MEGRATLNNWSFGQSAVSNSDRNNKPSTVHGHIPYKTLPKSPLSNENQAEINPSPCPNKRKMNTNDSDQNKFHKRMKYNIIDLTEPNKKINGNNKKNPIYISDSDDDDMVIYPDFPSPRSDDPFNDGISNIDTVYPDFSSPRSDDPFNDGISQQSNNIDDDTRSVSLPLSGFHQLNFKSSYVNANQDRKDVVTLTLSDLTLHGLMNANIKDINRQECSLINAIKDINPKHNVIASKITYHSRLLSISIGLLECMNNWNISQRVSMHTKPCVLIIASKRHACIEMEQYFKVIGKMFKYKYALLTGGIETYTQSLRKLERGFDILTGTPGRLSHMIKDGVLTESKLKNILCLVFDAFEDMHSQNMKKQITHILKALPSDRRLRVLMMTSATKESAQEDILQVGSGGKVKFIENDENKHLVSLRHYFCVAIQPKVLLLKSIIDHLTDNNSDKIVVFFNRKTELHNVYKQIKNTMFSNEEHTQKLLCVYGDLNVAERTKAIKNFKKDDDNKTILLTTDLYNDYNFNSKVFSIINYSLMGIDVIRKYIKRCKIGRPGSRVITLTSYEGELNRISDALKIDIMSFGHFARNQSVLNDRY